MSKGAMGIEFVVATAIFLIAFWFIYLQSAFMLTPQLQRGDIREPAVEYYSSILAADGTEGFAVVSSGSAKANILDKAKLDADDLKDCGDVQSSLVAGMEFAFRVTTSVKKWECNTTIAKRGVVRRAVYVKFPSGSYYPGILEVWAV